MAMPIKSDSFRRNAVRERPLLANGSGAQSSTIDAEGDPDFMTSLARGLCVLQSFARHKRSVTSSQLSASRGLSRAAVRRCLHTLTRLGFAASEGSTRYFLLPKVMTLGYAYLSSLPLVQAAQPILDRLGDLLGESCSLSVLDGEEIVYVLRAPMTRILSVDLHVGSRLPAFCTSMGRVLLSGLSDDELDTYLTRLTIRGYTARTVENTDRLRRIVKATQRTGYSITDQELEVGLRSIAVPIRNLGGRVVAALNAATHVGRIPKSELHKTFLPKLLESAADIGMLEAVSATGLQTHRKAFAV